MQELRRQAPWLVALAGVVVVTYVLSTAMISRLAQLHAPIFRCTYVVGYAKRQGCYQRVATSLIHREGPTQALAYLDHAAGENATLQAECHAAMHEVGARYGARLAGTLPGRVPLPTAEGNCVSGFLHGVLLGYVPTVRAGASVAPLARAICERPELSYYTRGNCYHGFGHALVAGRGANAAAAVPSCQQLRQIAANGAWMTEQCIGGIFMQMATVSSVAPDAYAATCAGSASASVSVACYGYLAYSEFTHGRSVRDALPLCAEAPLQAGSIACSGQTGWELQLSGVDGCSSIAGSIERDACIEGSLQTTRNTASALSGCTAAHGAVRDECLRLVGSALAQHLPVGQYRDRGSYSLRDCGRLNAKDAASCESGADDPIARELISRGPIGLALSGNEGRF
jgi:hypothetical protein